MERGDTGRFFEKAAEVGMVLKAQSVGYCLYGEQLRGELKLRGLYSAGIDVV